MASELIKRFEGTIDYQEEHGFTAHNADIDLSNEEMHEIIEALQAMADLETLTVGKDDCSIVVGSINTKDGTVFAVGKGQGSCAGWFDSIPLALRAAAEAIQKGGA